MPTKTNIPDSSYGVLSQKEISCKEELIREQVRRNGFAILESGYSDEYLSKLRDTFSATYGNYIKTWGKDHLSSIDELHTMRALLSFGDTIFLDIITNPSLLSVVDSLIRGKFILNQQNGILNLPQQKYNQLAWHRDLPYQHFVSDSPLAVNAIFCIDDFKAQNGSTWVLPSTHNFSDFPSQEYIERHAIQLEAKAGQYIILDCMVFHSGGLNQTTLPRRAINNVFTIPYFKQQINLSKNMIHKELPEATKELLGFNSNEPESIENYLNSRKQKISKGHK